MVITNENWKLLLFLAITYPNILTSHIGIFLPPLYTIFYENPSLTFENILVSVYSYDRLCSKGIQLLH